MTKCGCMSRRVTCIRKLIRFTRSSGGFTFEHSKLSVVEISPLHSKPLDRCPIRGTCQPCPQGRVQTNTVKSFRVARALAPEVSLLRPRRVFPQPVQPCRASVLFFITNSKYVHHRHPSASLQ